MVLAKNDEYPEFNSTSSFINIEAMDSHGGWKATAKDLAKLLVAIGPGSDYHLLHKESIELMCKGSEANPNYGLGWFLNSKGSCWHTGSLNNCSTFMARLSTGVCAVVLFNARPDDPEYFKELDSVIWKGVKNIKAWPSTDEFIEKPSTVAAHL